MEKTTTLTIHGMSCAHCESAVRQALAQVEGATVEDVRIGSARVTYDADRLDEQTLAAAVEEAGFEVQ